MKRVRPKPHMGDMTDATAAGIILLYVCFIAFAIAAVVFA